MGLVSCGVNCSFPLNLGAHKVFFMPSKPGDSCILQSCGSLVIKSWGLQGQIPCGFPVPLSGSQAGKPNAGFQTFIAMGELLWYYCSPVCGFPVGMRFDFIVIVALLPSCCGFFVFGRGISFFGRFQHPPVDGCSTTSCDFGSLAEGDERVSFYSTILNWKFSFINS